MESANLIAAWYGIMAGILSGVVMGLKFHREVWLGGYSSWSRRMVRLAHIAFFGLAFINVAYVLTVRLSDTVAANQITGSLLIIGAVAMPSVCYLAAWRKLFRHLFFIPVLSLLIGVGYFLVIGGLS